MNGAASRPHHDLLASFRKPICYLLGPIADGGRIGQPSDLGGIMVFLANEEAARITGGIFAIDGGFIAG